MDIKQLKKEFITLYGGSDEDIRIFHSPGRVNLIGEHTDYNGGLYYPEAPVNDSLAEKFEFKGQAEEFMAMGFDGIKLLESKPSLHKKLAYGIHKKGYDAFFKYIEDNDIPMNSHVADPHNFWDEDKVPPIFKEKGWFYGDGTYASIEEIYGEVYRFFATDNEYTAFSYYDSTCTLKGMGLSDEKVRAIECDNFVKLAGEKPKKIDKALLKKYIEKFLTYMRMRMKRRKKSLIIVKKSYNLNSLYHAVQTI